MLGLVFAFMCISGIGPDFIISENTGQVMLGLMYPLITIILAVSFLVPFLTDYGLMEFVGVHLRKVIRPLFSVPGRAAIDLLTSWLAAAPAAVMVTIGQYKQGFYTKREAACVMTNFSVVNIPFALLVAATAGVESHFVQMYLTVCFLGVVLAIIMPRIPPLSLIPNEQHPDHIDKAQESAEFIPSGVKAGVWARKLAADRASSFSVKSLLVSGNDMLWSVYFSTLAVVFAWGIIALVLIEFTPVFNWISYPFGIYLDLLGVENAFAAAPAVIGGLVDMYLPSIMVSQLPSFATRWIIATLSLIQIIYMTEIGVMMLQSKVDLNLWKLVAIYVIRTILAIPIIVIAANIIF